MAKLEDLTANPREEEKEIPQEKTTSTAEYIVGWGMVIFIGLALLGALSPGRRNAYYNHPQSSYNNPSHICYGQPFGTPYNTGNWTSYCE